MTIGAEKAFLTEQEDTEDARLRKLSAEELAGEIHNLVQRINDVSEILANKLVDINITTKQTIATRDYGIRTILKVQMLKTL